MTTFLTLRSAPSGPAFRAVNQDDTVLWDVANGRWYTGPQSASGGVTSWNGRVGAVVPQMNDYDSDQVLNLSSVPGPSVSDALDSLAASSGVTSWNGRVGAVVPQTNDYDSDQVLNLSSVPGSSVSDALDNLAAAGVLSWNGRVGVVVPLSNDYDSDQVANVSGVAGPFVSDALDTLAARISALNSTNIANVSTVTGATVTAALNTLATAVVGPAAGDLAGNYPNPSVVAVHTGATQLTVGTISTQSLVARVGTVLQSATLSAGLAFSAGQLAVTAVSNTAQGVAVAITAANAVLLSNGGGTAATWQAISGGGTPVGTSRLINTTAPLAGGGSLAADLTLSVAVVSNTSSGVVPAHAGAADVGKALIATATATTWSTNFQAQSLVTTGSLSLDASPATAGSLRGGSGFRAVVATGGVNKDWFTYDQPNDTFVFNSETNNGANRASIVSINYGSAGRFVVLQNGTEIFRVASGVVVVTTTSFQFAAAVVAPRITQTAGGNGTGASLTISAMSMAGIGGAVGGSLVVAAGDATGASGSRTGGAITIRTGQGATADGPMAIIGGNGANGLMMQVKDAANTTLVQILNWDSSSSGQLQVGNGTNVAILRLMCTTTLAVTSPAAPSATAGASTLPVTPQEFMLVTFNGNVRKIPLYLN